MPTQRLFYTLLLILLLPFGARAEHAFSAMYIFGDSLSDTGNLASITAPLPPPFFENRISNGPVAVETLAANLGLAADASLHLIGPEVGTNYAVAGASAAGAEVIDLGSQVGLFLLNHGNAAPSDNLYVMFIGGNDIRAARDEPNDDAATDIINNAIAAVDANMRTLVGAGAQSILVVNAPDIGIIPETQLIADLIGDPGFAERASELSHLYNTRLRQIIRGINSDLGIAAVYADLKVYFSGVRNNGLGLGYTNIDDACFDSVNFIFHPDCDLGANFDRFVFFDFIHPTASVHRRAGRAMYSVTPETL